MCENVYFNKKVNYHEVHGTIKEDNLTIGIEGTFELPKAFNFLKKGLQETYSKGINVEHLLRNGKNIHFYGFSLGETDSPYFRQFFGAYSSPENLSSENVILYNSKKMIFFYYDQNGYDQIIDRIDDLTGHNVDRLRQANEIEFIDLKKYEQEVDENNLMKYFPVLVR